MLGLTIVAGQQPAPDAVYTAEQATAGRAVYEASCAGCHMRDMAGRNEASPLAGPNFINAWRGRTTRELFEYIATTMPPGNANLPTETYLAITAYILQANGATSGSQPFAATTALPIGSVATGERPAVAGTTD